MEKYDLWISTEVLDPHGNCGHYCQKMKLAFPELILQRGYYICCIQGKRPHWWLKTEDGTIVDPTVAQFAPCGEYEVLDESKGEPTGRCPNCGELSYNHRTCCSSKCNDEYANYVMGREL